MKTNELKIICPFCNAPYTAEMEDNLSIGDGCESCGYGSCSGSVDVICSNCKKVVYKKEIDK